MKSPASIVLIITTCGTLAWVCFSKFTFAHSARRVIPTSNFTQVTSEPRRVLPTNIAKKDPQPAVNNLAAEATPENHNAPDQESQVVPNIAMLSALPEKADGSIDYAQLPQTRLLGSWMNSQNEGDFSGYANLYHESFAGIKRVGGSAVQYDLPKWLEDRRKMFNDKMEVIVSDVEFKFARDMSEVKVEFTQQWSSRTFSDLGRKSILLKPFGSEWKIVREEMLWSKVLRK